MTMMVRPSVDALGIAVESCCMASIEYRVESAGSPAAAIPIAALDDELSRQYPGLPVNGIDATDFEAGGGVFAIGYVDGRPAVSGAFRP